MVEAIKQSTAPLPRLLNLRAQHLVQYISSQCQIVYNYLSHILISFLTIQLIDFNLIFHLTYTLPSDSLIFYNTLYSYPVPLNITKEVMLSRYTILKYRSSISRKQDQNYKSSRKAQPVGFHELTDLQHFRKRLISHSILYEKIWVES